MPSIRELGQFKSSFMKIANEEADIKSRSLPFEDLKLPAKEAPPFNYSRDMHDDVLDSLDISSDSPDSPASGDDFDITFVPPPPPIDTPSDFSAIDDLLSNISPPADDFDVFDSAAETGEEPPPEPQTDNVTLETEDLSLPHEDEPPDLSDGDLSASDDFLSGFSQDDVPTDFKSDDLPAGDFSSDDLPSFDLSSDDFPTFDSPAADTPADKSNFDNSDSETQLISDDDFSFDAKTDDDSGSFDLGSENPFDSAGSSDFTDVDSSSGDFSFDSGSIDLGGETPEPGVVESASDDFSLDDMFAGFDKPDLGDFSDGAASVDTDGGAAVDLGDLGSDFDSDSIALDETPAEDASHADNVFGSDDFSLSGLDDILKKSKVEPVPAPAPKKGARGKKDKTAAPEAEEEIEEISLDQDDVDNILRTLSQYPLNLRIVCEELIAEQVILPQQLSKLIRLLVNGASVKEAAAHAESITGKPIVIPKSFEKMTGAAFEEEQASFGYIFVHNFLPVLRMFAFIAAVAGSVLYLSYRFIYIPLRAESLYQRGYERIPAGEYTRANELFYQAFNMHRKKTWFYSYAEAFAGQRRYSLAEGKYDELLKFYPRDKKGLLDYAGLNTYYLMNYEKANRLLQRELLDYAPNDMEGLLAAGDNFLMWADSNPSKFYDKYEDARFSYARLLDIYGWQAPIAERMMKYFIRTDNLRETLNIRLWFESYPAKRKLSPESLAELGGYLLDKQLEKPAGVPDPYIESIESVRSMLLQAVMEKPTLPEPHYHLARYYNNLSNTHEERLTLENAIRAFNMAQTESVLRRNYRIDTHYRYANLLINNREFFPAEEQVVRGIELFEDFYNRNLISPSPKLGQLYSLKGDLEYFVKTGNMEAALRNYRTAEGYGYSPPEVQYRMGAAYYQLEDWRNALDYLFKASSELPLNRRMLFALGNSAFQRGDYFAAQGYFNRLLDILESQRIRLPVLLPNDSVQFLETGERLMMARNNLGAVNEALADQTGNRDYRSQALVMYAESSRAWDAITRNPETMIRMRLTDSPGAPSINLGYLNANNALRPNSNYNPQVFSRIDKDVLEPSKWEELTGY